MKRLLPALAALLSLAIQARADLQGTWIASVHNINFPSKQGLPIEVQKQQANRLLDAAQSAGLNAVMLQVRPEGDALYASSLEPWSRYLTGTQGANPGYDPLAYFIAQAKARGLQVHAWINPYRAGANASHPRSSKHISRIYPQYCFKVGTTLWMDPGSPEVRRHINSVVRELVERYDIAGVHLDDYFYHYPTFPRRQNLRRLPLLRRQTLESRLAPPECPLPHPRPQPDRPLRTPGPPFWRQPLRHPQQGHCALEHQSRRGSIPRTLLRSCGLDAAGVGRLPLAAALLEKRRPAVLLDPARLVAKSEGQPARGPDRSRNCARSTGISRLASSGDRPPTFPRKIHLAPPARWVPALEYRPRLEEHQRCISHNPRSLTS